MNISDGMVFFLIVILVVLAQSFFPWWTMPLVCYIVSISLGRSAWGTFFSAFFAVFFVWAIKAFWADIQNDQILSERMGQMLGIAGEWLFMISAVFGAVLGSLAALAGYYTKSIFLKKKSQAPLSRATFS
jgi:hypothetical protein